MNNRSETRRQTQNANRALVLKILRIEAFYVAPLTALVLYLITKHLWVSCAIGLAIFSAGIGFYAFLKRVFRTHDHPEAAPTFDPTRMLRK
jgi:energy-converting hydrogenase Eha subunit G